MIGNLKPLRLGPGHAASGRVGARADVVVGSKLDTEATLLGNMILMALEANGIATEDRITLGGTPVVRKAIIGGEIDIYPEYTGNAAFFFNKADDPLWKDHAPGLRGRQAARLRRQQDRLADAVARQQHLGDRGAPGCGRAREPQSPCPTSATGSPAAARWCWPARPSS